MVIARAGLEFPRANVGARGGCLCGSIRYRFVGAPASRGRCHCRSCRLAAGAPAVAWLVVKCEDFAFVAGEPERYRSSNEVIRTFCRRCGTSLTYQHDDSPDLVEITTATLDAPDAYPPTHEIWLEHRIAWEPVDESVRHFARDTSGG